MALLDNLDTVREKAAEVAQAAARKTKQLAEIAKTNVSIYTEEDKIKKAYAELGKLYYRDYVVGEERDEAEYLPFCRQIDEAKQTIADLQDYIAEVKAAHVDMDTEDVVSEEDFAEAEADEIACVEASTEAE